MEQGVEVRRNAARGIIVDIKLWLAETVCGRAEREREKSRRIRAPRLRSIAQTDRPNLKLFPYTRARV